MLTLQVGEEEGKMQVPPIINRLLEAPDIKLLIKAIEGQEQEHLIYGLTGIQKTVVSALIAHKINKSMLVVCENSNRAKEIWEDISNLLPDYKVLYFPALELIPFEVLAQSNEVQKQRLQVLAALARGEKIIVVSPVDALSVALLAPRLFIEALREIAVGQIVDIEGLVKYLVQYGYERVEQVETQGQFSLRGGILDVYSVLYEMPIRMELFDDEVDSIRFFDIESQRSNEKTQKICLIPAKEFFLLQDKIDAGIKRIENELVIQRKRLEGLKKRDALEKLNQKVGETLEKVKNDIVFPGLEQLQPFFYPEQGNLLDFFPMNSIFCFDEPMRLHEAVKYKEKERRYSFTQLLDAGSVLPGQSSFYTDFNYILQAAEKGKRIFNSLLPKKGFTGKLESIIGVETRTLPPFFAKVRILADEIKEWKRKKYAIVILVTSQAKAVRLQQALHDCKVEAHWIGENFTPQSGQVILAKGNLSSGFEFAKGRLVVVTEKELFQQPKKRQIKKMFHQDGKQIKKITELNIGDYVVHAGHGIGKYLGVERLNVGGIQRDYIIVKYAGEDRLYVPTDQVNLLQKYVAGEGKPPKVHKLGGAEWQKTKARVTSSVRKMAEGLIELYAKRQSLPGHSFHSDDNWQREFEDAFPYKETPDQLHAIREVKKDMEKKSPMDRLICGDVGYGKTEVAIRAAFKAINEGKQTAVLVPTTVLAQQHFNTFRERFANYPVAIEVVSRFKSSSEQRKIIEGLEKGSVDIVIGTHRLLSKDINFKDLGLLIVDEEQRFGVTHKEKLKKLKSQVDVLTLSATPIPRTLHMSLVGIRDMSVIETPPEDRYPIQTYVVENTPELVREAIRRELGRGGQVYYVHNRVEDIERKAEEIRDLVPEARIGIGHGKMKEDQLEKVMMSFMEKELDVLLCTTIIETGLDISNVNTLIVDDADKMGLSQLYQLRGRVGRTNRIAYAFLTYKKDKMLSPLAEKRLHAIREFTELGSGFKIAMRDLEIRGAGNLLGAEQHGHVASVGFDMYCKLLEETVQELKGEKTVEKIEVEIDLQVSSFIPENYINESSVKLEFYQKINNVSKLKQIYDIEEELEDRFGDIPAETRNLLYIAKLRVLAMKSKINSIKQQGESNVILSFAGDPGLSGQKLLEMAEAYRRRLSFSAEANLRIKLNIAKLKTEAYLDLIEKILLEISTLVAPQESLL